MTPSLSESRGASAKPVVALVHGWGFGPPVWDALAESLRARYTVQCVALPGYADAAPDDASFAETARRIGETLPPGAILCAWSLGALLALKAARLFPSRFSGLLLLAASPCFMQREDWACAMPPALLDAFTASVAKDPASALSRFNALLNQGDTQAKNAIRVLSRAAPPDRAVLLKGLAWLREIDLRGDLASIALPVRLCHGDKDPLMPLEAAVRMAERLPDARLLSIPGAAHAPFLQAPDDCVRLIDEIHAHASGG